MYDARLSDYCAFAVESRAECVYLSLMVEWKLHTKKNIEKLIRALAEKTKGNRKRFKIQQFWGILMKLFAASPYLIGDRSKSIPLTIVNDSICDKAEKKMLQRIFLWKHSAVVWAEKIAPIKSNCQKEENQTCFQ